MSRPNETREATKLGAYEGDWVYQGTTKQDPLIIMTIWRKIR